MKLSQSLLIALLLCLTVTLWADGNNAQSEPQSNEDVRLPRPLSPTVQKGIEWLISRQLEGGGWGQGEESAHMHRPAQQDGNQNTRDLPNVADTCMVTLALIRAGSTPSEGPHSTAVNRAIDFVCTEIEAADVESLWITSVRGTRVQSKIGPHVDTFLAALLLVEVKDNMPTKADTDRVTAALTKTMDKIERHQQADGRWGTRGWAGGLSNIFAVKAINRATQVGIEVDESVRERAEQSAQTRAQPGLGGGFAAGGDSAGIELYAAASAVGELADAAMTNLGKRRDIQPQRATYQERITEIESQLAEANGGDDMSEIKEELESVKAQMAVLDTLEQRFDRADADLKQAQQALRQRMQDDRFVAGFGSNGGEEFISYLNIGEALVVEGGEAWKEFETRMATNLSNVQNDDGSWTGHHCITGRTFCTASALMVLTIDRSPNAFSAKLMP